VFLSVVPMSWRRAVRKYVSLKEGVDQVGKAWERIAWPDASVSTLKVSLDSGKWENTIVEDSHAVVESLDREFFLSIFLDGLHERGVREFD